MNILKQQYIQILCAIFLGFIVAISFDQSSIFIPLGDIFVRLLKMMIVPIPTIIDIKTMGTIIIFNKRMNISPKGMNIED